MNITPIAKLLVKRPKMVILVFTIITAIIGVQATNVYMVSDLLHSFQETIQLCKYGMR